jgi:hypothetical protein
MGEQGGGKFEVQHVGGLDAVGERQSWTSWAGNELGDHSALSNKKQT